MNYTMTICMGEQLPKISNPTQDKIERAIDNLIPPNDHFIILCSEENVKNSSFIQTTMEANDSGESRYLLEIQFCYDKEYKQYAIYMKKIDKVKEIFLSYTSGILPDITGWNDITKKIFPTQKKKDRKKKL